MNSEAMLWAARSALCRFGHNNRAITNTFIRGHAECLIDGIRHRARTVPHARVVHCDPINSQVTLRENPILGNDGCP